MAVLAASAAGGGGGGGGGSAAPAPSGPAPGPPAPTPPTPPGPPAPPGQPAPGVAAPAVTGFSPALGFVGSTITVDGANLAGATAVAFNGVPAARFTIVGPTRVTAVVAPGTTTGSLSVTTADGTATSSASFRFVAPPRITGLSPASGRAGATVLIDGTDLDVATAVVFSGAAAASFTVVGPTRLSAVVAAGTATGVVGVVTPAGVTTSSAPFTLARTPLITTFGPTTGWAGTAVFIEGLDLFDVLSVRFNGTEATLVPLPYSAVIAIVGSGTTTGPVEVTTTGGSDTSSAVFTAVPPPVITGFSPTSGGAGTVVTITGANLASAPHVRFNGALAGIAAVGSGTLDVVVPIDASTGPISVPTTSGVGTSTTPFVFVPVPTITGFDPYRATVGDVVDIRGRRFTGATAVLFGAGAADTFQIVQDDLIRVVVPPWAVDGDLSVVSSAGTGTAPTPFTFDRPPPVVTGFTPASGGPGTTVTLSGAYFDQATSVLFADTEATSFAVVDSATITAVVDLEATSGRITVTTTTGRRASAAPFTFLAPAPTLSGFAPAVAEAGDEVTITGTNLMRPTAVTFGGGPRALVTVATPTRLVVAVPPGSSSGSLSVTTPGGAATLAGFTLLAPPEVLSVSAPSPAAVVSGCVLVTYTVRSAQGRPVDVIVELDASGLGSFLPANTRRCTQAGGAPGVEPFGVVGVPTSTTGVVHSFRWSSTADLPHRDVEVALRVRAARGGASGAPSTPVTFTVANGVAFAAASALGGGPAPASVTAADVNVDGALDLVVADGLGVAVRLGNRDGTFQPALDHAAGTTPVDVAVGDVNRDGAPDLVVANAGSDDVSVLLGNRDGTFQAAVDHAAGAGPGALVLADLDLDGDLDVVVANGGGAGASVLLGSGAGAFGAAQSFGAGSAPRALALADLNRDGVLDLVTADGGTASVSVLQGLSNGAFLPRSSVGVGAAPAALEAVDLGRDGRVDLLVATAAGLVLLPGLGDGTFGPRQEPLPGVDARGLATADLDGDGLLDAAVTSVTSDAVVVLLGAVGGTLQPPRALTLPGGPGPLAVADLDRDGRPDLVAGAASGLAALLNATARPCETGLVAGLQDGPGLGPGLQPQGIALADLNGDGKLDQVVAYHLTDDVAVLLGRGDGTWAPAVRYAAGDGPEGVAIGDVTEDGVLDLVVPSSGSQDVSVLEGVGDGTFLAARRHAAGTGSQVQPAAVAIADLDGDGLADLVVANVAIGDPGVGVLLGIGGGAFAPATEHPTSSAPLAVTVCDVDRDGRPDVLTGVDLLRGTGGGALGPAEVPDDELYSPCSDVEARDLNRDGFPDLVLARRDSFNGAQVRLGDARGRFGPLRLLDPDDLNWRPGSVEVQDLDQDGRLDLVFGDATHLDVLRGDGAGGFARRSATNVGGRVEALALGDLDGDGRADAALASGGRMSSSTVFLGAADGSFPPEEGDPLDCQAVEAVHLGDLDRDGRAELVVVGTTGGLAPILAGPPGGRPLLVGSLQTIAPASPLLVDLSRDGAADLVAANPAGLGSLEVRLGDGFGRFHPSQTAQARVRFAAMVAADMDRDGRLDLVGVHPSQSTVTIALGRGTSDFQTTIVRPAGPQPGGVAVGDLDHDGALDIAVANGVDGADNVSLLYGDGAGGFSAPVPLSAGPAPQQVAIGDVDGDGRNDLVVANGQPNPGTLNEACTLSVFLGLRAGGFRAPVEHTVGRGPSAVVLRDLNSDGRPDVVVTNESSQNLSVLLGQPGGVLGPARSYEAGTDPAPALVDDVDGDGRLDVVVGGRQDLRGRLTVLRGR